MRRFAPLLFALAAFACDDNPCEDKSGLSNCGYCSEDRLATDNPHAGMCRYCGANTYCTGRICGEDLTCVKRVYLAIPRATFNTGKAPAATSGGRVPSVKQVLPQAGSLSVGGAVTWTIEWEVTVVVTAVYIEVTGFDGYWEVPITEEQANAGSAQVVMTETSDLPGESGCLGPTTCWREAPESKTTGETAFELVGGGDVGQPAGGIGLTWEEPSYSQTQTPPDNGNGCASSAAQLGCCTTSGGIQKVGVWVSGSCQCPSDTCARGGNYCGCPACGGC